MGSSQSTPTPSVFQKTKQPRVPQLPLYMDKQPSVHRDGLHNDHMSKSLFEGRDGRRELMRNENIGAQSAVVLAN
jgi:hypothetical protein